MCFRQNHSDDWLPSPVERDKCYHFGQILTPEHPAFRTPHALTSKQIADVHCFSIYHAVCRLGAGWTALGTVGHWGHVHTRKNRYDAVITVRVVGGVWKITGLKLLEEKRIDPYSNEVLGDSA